MSPYGCGIGNLYRTFRSLVPGTTWNSPLATIARLLLAGLCFAASGWLLLGAYRRAPTAIQLVRYGSYVVTEGGIITEKLVQYRADPLLPFPVRSYVVRYSFPAPPLGSIRNGEQVVTGWFYRRLGGMGSPAVVYIAKTNNGINAVDARLVFPGAAGWVFSAGVAALAAALSLLLSFIRSIRAAPDQDVGDRLEDDTKLQLQ